MVVQNTDFVTIQLTYRVVLFPVHGGIRVPPADASSQVCDYHRRAVGNCRYGTTTVRELGGPVLAICLPRFLSWHCRCNGYLCHGKVSGMSYLDSERY